jgi:hypothetical protein
MNALILLFLSLVPLGSISTNYITLSEPTSVAKKDKIEEIKTTLIVADKHRLQLTLNTEAEVGFELHDASGTIIHEWHDRSIRPGIHLVELPMPSLSVGKYLLQITADDEETHSQLLYKS